MGARRAAHPVLGRGRWRDDKPVDLRGRGPQAVDLSISRRRGSGAAGGGATYPGPSARGEPTPFDYEELSSPAGAARVRQRALHRRGRPGAGGRALYLHRERPFPNHGHGHGTATDHTDHTDHTDSTGRGSFTGRGSRGRSATTRTIPGDSSSGLRQQTIRWCARVWSRTRSRGFCARTAFAIDGPACRGGLWRGISAYCSGRAPAIVSSSASSSGEVFRSTFTRAWASLTPTRQRMRWP